MTGPITELSRVEAELTALLLRRDDLRREVIERMTRSGVSQKATGDVLGLSHQRVSQLANSA